MSTFTLNWNNSLVLANVNAINQRAYYRIKTVGGSFLTTGFTPSNDMSTAVVSATLTGTANKIYEFKIAAVCTSGGPTYNDNGIVEQIVFQCITPTSLVATQTTATIVVNFSSTDITKAKWSIRKQGDNSLVQAVITTVSGSTSHIFTGLTSNTAYYVTVEYYTTINGSEVISSSSSYLNSICGGNVSGYQITTSATDVANLVFSWNIPTDAGELINLTSNINGSFTSVDWGDGTINTLLTHTYAATGIYTVQIYGSTASIITLGNASVSLYNLIALTAIPNTVTHLDVKNNSLATIPSLASNTSLIYLDVTSNTLTAFPNISANILLEELYLSKNNIAGSYNFTLNTALVYVELYRNSITGISGLINATSLSSLLLDNNGISVSDINTSLVALDTNGVTSGSYTSQLQSPLATPTGLGATAKANLISKGWTITTD